MKRTRTLTWTCRRCQHQWTELLEGKSGSDNSHHFTLCDPCLDKLVIRRVCGVLRLMFRDGKAGMEAKAAAGRKKAK